MHRCQVCRDAFDNGIIGFAAGFESRTRSRTCNFVRCAGQNKYPRMHRCTVNGQRPQGKHLAAQRRCASADRSAGVRIELKARSEASTRGANPWVTEQASRRNNGFRLRPRGKPSALRINHRPIVLACTGLGRSHGIRLRSRSKPFAFDTHTAPTRD